MTLIIKDIQMSKQTFHAVNNKIRNRVQNESFHHYSAWWSSSTGTGQFKISDKMRNILEVILLDYA